MPHSNSKTLRLVVVYHPPSSRTNGLTNDLFFKEFETFLEHLAAHKDQITVVGDFNFHVDDQFAFFFTKRLGRDPYQVFRRSQREIKR